MRMFKKESEDSSKVVYSYLCEDYKRPYSGIIEISKATKKAIVKKPAVGERDMVFAAVYAQTSLPKANYPKHYTHSAY